MTNLLALCKPTDGVLTIKRVQITQPVQDIVGGLFHQQAIEFLEGIEEEIPFGGDYKPDADEILVLDAPNEIGLMQASVSNPIGLETISAGNFINENIRGLFVGAGDGVGARILIQAFTAQQLLTRNRLMLIHALDGNTFRQVTEPSFTLDSKLVAIAEGGRLKFKSFHLVKRIFALDEVYRVATDQQIDAFCGHASLQVPDLNAFKTSADQIIRKLVHAVSTSNVLDQCPVADIQTKAAALEVPLEIQNGRIDMPMERQQIKQLLRFLDDSIYEGPISARRLVTNSKRPFGAAP
jgi:hypothetical protein